MSSTPGLQALKTRQLNGSGSESSPAPVLRGRTTSSSTELSVHSSSTASSSRNRFHSGLLMPDTAPNPHAKARLARYRQRVKQKVFNDIDLDWKSTPVVCDESYDFATLLHHRELRCKASIEYLQQVRDDMQQKAAAAADVAGVSESENASNVVCIDGEEMIDMIG